MSTVTELANPAYRRLDVWQSLEEAGRRLAATPGAGCSTVADTPRVGRPLVRLATIRAVLALPDAAGLRRLQELLDEGDAARLADEITQAVQLLTMVVGAVHTIRSAPPRSASAAPAGRSALST